MDGESLPAQIIIKGIAVQQYIFKRKTAFEIWFNSQHKFIERDARLVCISDRFIHRQLIDCIIEDCEHCIVCACGGGRRSGGGKSGRSEFKRWERRIGGREWREGGDKSRRVGRRQSRAGGLKGRGGRQRARVRSDQHKVP